MYFELFLSVKYVKCPTFFGPTEKDVGSCAQPAGASSSWTGWAVTGMSSITSKLIRNAPGTEGVVGAEGSGPANATSPTSATDTAPAPGRVYNMNQYKSWSRLCIHSFIHVPSFISGH